jgi:hypothetical protein
MVVTVRTKELLKILEENRTAHLQEFDNACKIYRKRVLEELGFHRSAIADFEAAFKDALFRDIPKFPDINLHKLPKPVSYAKNYDRAIGMLQLHSKEEMTIDMETYQKFVDDEWEWSAQARMSNSSYLAGG